MKGDGGAKKKGRPLTKNQVWRNKGPKVRSMTLRIMTWNIDGFNDPAQRLSVVAYSWKHRVDIAVLAESHLLDEGIFRNWGRGRGDSS